MTEENTETRPFENEHSCRLRNPKDFKDGSFRRTTRNHDGKEYGVIMGKLKGKTSMTEQAYRYKKDVWSASSAKSHCKDHDGSFEAAKSSKSELKEETERRILPVDGMEIRVDDGEKPKLVGYAAKTGVWADLHWFKEKIKKGAFSDVLEDDVRCLKNHDPNLILGRTTNETLRMEENTVGLHYEDDLPDTNVGRDIREEVKRKDITGCSFAFRVAEDEWKYFEDERVPERTIIKLKRLFDVGPVTYPAYSDTTVAARSFDKFKAEHEVQEEEEEKDNKNTPEHSSENEEPENKNNDEISPERQRGIDKRLRKAERIINRCKKSAEI